MINVGMCGLCDRLVTSSDDGILSGKWSGIPSNSESEEEEASIAKSLIRIIIERNSSQPQRFVGFPSCNSEVVSQCMQVRFQKRRGRVFTSRSHHGVELRGVIARRKP